MQRDQFKYYIQLDRLFLCQIPSLASKQEHVTPKHDLIEYQTWHEWSLNIWSLANNFFSHFFPYIPYKFRRNVWKKSKNFSLSDSLQTWCKVSAGLEGQIGKGWSPSGESSRRYPWKKILKVGSLFLPKKNLIWHNWKKNRWIGLKLCQRDFLVSGQLCVKYERSTSK